MMLMLMLMLLFSGKLFPSIFVDYEQLSDLAV